MSLSLIQFDSIPKKAKTLFGVALVFALLGFANIMIGNSKYQQFQLLLSKGLASTASSDSSSVVDNLLDEEPTSPEDTAAQPVIDQRYLDELAARRDFYAFVRVGGRWIVAISAFLIILGLVGLRGDSDRLD